MCYRDIKVDYKIECTIGKGSFGTVKRAKHRETGIRYAVKVMSKRKMSADDRNSLMQEIDIMKTIDHPNIIRMLDLYEDERHYCLVMEWMQGGELFDKILSTD